MPLRSLTLLVLLLGPTLVGAEEKFDPAPVERILREAVKEWNVPGLACAIIQDDEVVYLEGLGVRKAGGKDPVTADTIFSLGSITKAFTACTVGVLVDQGRARWDDPVRKHLPWFRLADPLADRDIRLRDLLCHRTGLARHDLLWYRAPWTVEETIRRMAFLEPASSFRSRYEYNNLPFLVAGQVVGETAGLPWHAFARKHLLDPLGMKAVLFTRGEAEKAKDFATPHQTRSGGKLTPIEWYADDKQIRASGSLKASARDMTRWLRFQLGDGTFDGLRVLSAATLAETQAPQVVVPVTPLLARHGGTTQASYGLGWHISDYRGQQVLDHGGATDGFRARVVLLPRRRTAFILLTNCEEMGCLQAAGYRLTDHLCRLEAKPWHALVKESVKAAADQTRERKRAWVAARRPGTKPSLELGDYVGKYQDRAYGTLEVEKDGKGLVLRWSSFRVALAHFHFDTFTLQVEEGSRLAGEAVAFGLDGEGQVAEARFLGRVFRRAEKR